MSLSASYFQTVTELQKKVAEANAETLSILGAAIGESIKNDGVLHVFGSGHSQILASEMERRAGGLVPISSIFDPADGWAEQLPGFGNKLFDRYSFIYGAKAGEHILVISNSGKNSSPLEVAYSAKERGLKVIALTSLSMSQNVKSLHHSGHRLFEMADYVLDNGGIAGDAMLQLENSPLKVGPTSTMSGAMLLNLLHVEIIDYLVEQKVDPLPIYISQNLPQGAEHNRKLCIKYSNRIRKPI
jgi:uncharacterized phosphosugar-binding protein